MKKLIPLFILIFVPAIIFANQVSTNLDLKDTETFINKVKVKIILPDSTIALAVVDEYNPIKITIGKDHYMFSPRIVNLEEKTVVMDNIFSSDESADSFQFEVIDIVSFPVSHIKVKACYCCITCEGTQTKVCACSVEMCGESCCCDACCTPMM